MRPPQFSRILGSIPILLALGLLMVAVLFLSQKPATPKRTHTEETKLGEVPSLVPYQASSEFQDWAEGSKIDLKEGIRLAKVRRTHMERLIVSDPDQALREMLPLKTYVTLPDEIRSIIEQPFVAMADLSVIPFCSNGVTTTSEVQTDRYHATWEGDRREVFLAADREGILSKKGVSLSGIVIGEIAAVHGSPVWRISEDEFDAAQHLFGLKPSADPGEVAIVGGQVLEASLEVERLLRKAEVTPGPNTVREVMTILSNTGDAPTEDLSAAIALASSSWTETPKNLLFIRLIFPDKPTPDSTEAEVESTLQTVSTRLEAMSHGKTYFPEPDATSEVFELPRTSDAYLALTDGSIDLHADAVSLAEAAGYNMSDYDIVGVIFPHINFPWVGRGAVGGSFHALNGALDVGVMLHEFGHNYGLWHASAWQADDGTILPAPGESQNGSPHIEYGDIYDIMGTGPDEADYHVFAKRLLEWIDESKVETLTGEVNGIYRLYRFDHADADENARLALKVQKDTSETIWVSYRRSITSSETLSNGAYLIWQYHSAKARLLDSTPDSDSSSGFKDRLDAPLALGQTFVDPTQLVNITPIAQGGTGAGEWLDIQVTLGVPGNQAPTVNLSGPSSATAGETVTLSAAANDADDDTLLYTWNFGDGSTPVVGAATMDHVFATGGEVTVTVSVNDQRGGHGEAMHTITVNRVPTATLANPASVITAESTTFTADANDADGDELLFHWNFGDGTSSDGTASIEHTYQTSGNYEVTVSVDDQKGGQAVAMRSVTATHAPLVELSGPTTGVPRETLTFTASGSDPDGDSLVYHWDFGNGFSVASGSDSVEYSFPLGGQFTVTVTADDQQGGQTSASLVITLQDGITAWTEPSTGIFITLYDVIHAEDKFLTAGSSYAYESADGLSWTRHDTDMIAWGLGHGDDTFMMVGYRYESADAAYYARIQSSPDGSTWTNEVIPQTTSRLRSIAYGNGIWIAVGNDGIILRKTAESSWEQQTSNTTQVLGKVIFAAGAFMAGGDNDTLLRSTDGITWEDLSEGLDFASWEDINDIVYHEGIFVIASRSTGIWRSTDLGNSWEHVSIGETDVRDIRALVSANGFVFATGARNDSSPSVQENYVSHDAGLTWIATLNASASTRRAAVYGARKVLTVGNSGLVQVSGVTDSLNFDPVIELSGPSVGSVSESLVFSVQGSDPDNDELRYTWNFGEGSSPQEGTSVTHAFQQEGVYTVTVTADDQRGGTTSESLEVSIYQAPSISQQPAGGTFTAGDSVVISVTATGTNLSYHWKKDDVSLPGQTSSELSLSAVSLTDSGTYTVDVSNPLSVMTSHPAVVQIVDVVPVITGQPTGGTFTVGDQVTLTVSATGENLSYQWTKNSQPIEGATGSMLTLSTVTLEDDGAYVVNITNSGGTVSSEVAAILVTDRLPVITSHPIGGSFEEGATVVLMVTVEGENISYQWKKNGSALSGQMAAILSLTNLSAADLGNYAVEVTNSGGTVSSLLAVLQFTEPDMMTFEDWKEEKTLAGEEPDDLLPLADPDGDGLNNLFEYYYDSEPKQAGPAAVAESKVEKENDVDYIVVEFAKSTTNTDVMITFEGSNEPTSNWTTLTHGENGVEIQDTAAKFIVRLPSTSSYKFVRMTLTLN